MVEEQVLDRSIQNMSVALAGYLRERQPNITDAEINAAARNFVEFIRVLRAMDREQKAKV